MRIDKDKVEEIILKIICYCCYIWIIAAVIYNIIKIF